MNRSLVYLMMNSNMIRIVCNAVGIATLLAVAACAPVIGPRAGDLVEGSPKTATAVVLTRLCTWKSPESVQFRLSNSSTWIDAPSPTMTSGEIKFYKTSWWKTPIPDSESFHQGESYVVKWTIPYWRPNSFSTWCPSASNPSDKTVQQTFTVTRAFSVSANPHTVELPAGGSAPLTVQVTRFGTFTAPVEVNVGGLAPGLTVSPASSTVTGASEVFTLSAATNASAGSGNGTLSGTSQPRTAHHATFTVMVTRPTVTGVSPSKAARGAGITVQGTRFDSNCANNVVTLAGVNVVPVSCTSSSVNLQVPENANYGPTQLFVTVNNVATNHVPFSVARSPGSFIDITNDIQGRRDSPRTCPTGEVQLDVTGSYVASYRRTADNRLIGSTIPFQEDTPLMTPYPGATPYVWIGAGGAGFSLCSTGIVLDANALDNSSHVLAFRFLRLDDGVSFSKAFDYFTAVIVNSSGTREHGSVAPDLYRSPDGTVFIAIVASAAGVQKKALVIDRQTGNTLGTVEFEGIGGNFSATLNSSNAVNIVHAGRNYPAISIP